MNYVAYLTKQTLRTCQTPEFDCRFI